jgi:hypothetical protein
MIENGLEICPDCRVALPAHLGDAHPYFGASPSCWALYGEVLAREYTSPQLMGVHRLTVDAYAAQHPGKPERRSIQSVWVHLAGLYLTIERDLSHEFARRVIDSLTTLSEPLEWLEPPEHLGTVTAVHVHRGGSPDEHRAAVHGWAESVWAAWRPHRLAVVTMADRAAEQL